MIAASAGARLELAPTGTVRVAINTANPATVRIDVHGDLSGPAIDLARALGETFGLPVEFVRFPAAAHIVASELRVDAWDVAFLAVDPARAERLHFSPPYMTIEAGYVVPARSLAIAIEPLDRPGTRIATSEGAAYDLHLKRTLRFAQRCPFATPQRSFDEFSERGLDAAAGVCLALEQRFGGDAAFRILPGHFLSIQQAIVTPIDRQDAAELIDRFIDAHCARTSGRE